MRADEVDFCIVECPDEISFRNVMLSLHCMSEPGPEPGPGENYMYIIHK